MKPRKEIQEEHLYNMHIKHLCKTHRTNYTMNANIYILSSVHKTKRTLQGWFLARFVLPRFWGGKHHEYDVQFYPALRKKH